MKFVSSLIVGALGALLSPIAMAQQTQAVGPYKDFKGVIKLDIRDSVADWGPFTPKAAPKGTDAEECGGDLKSEWERSSPTRTSSS